MKLTHLDQNGRPKMVDVADKNDTSRIAIAKGLIQMKKETLEEVIAGTIKKGDVLSVAQTAGIMAVKNTANAIPMCHNILIAGVEMDFQIDQNNNQIEIEVRAKSIGKTGIEMEALHGVTIAALTIYDMCKGIDQEMVISNIRLERKEGGKSGLYVREES